jgi:uncharacterized membrane protein YphA (DoxX/SURF4 family)
MWIFIAAFVLRIGIAGAFFAHSKFSWGKNELAGIARSLLEEHGFFSAFHDSWGPTAWFAPAYPALLACIFRVFGVETRASAIVAVFLNVIFASLTASGRPNFCRHCCFIHWCITSLMPLHVFGIRLRR